MEADRAVEPRRQIEAQGVPRLDVEPPLQIDGAPPACRAGHRLSPAQLGGRAADANRAMQHELPTIEIEAQERCRDGTAAEGTAHGDAAQVAVRAHDETGQVRRCIERNVGLHSRRQAARDLTSMEGNRRSRVCRQALEERDTT